MISDIIVASGFFTLIRCWHFKLTSIQIPVVMSTSSFDSYWYLHELLSPTYTPFYSKIISRYHYWYQKIRSESSCRRFCFIVTQKMLLRGKRRFIWILAELLRPWRLKQNWQIHQLISFYVQHRLELIDMVIHCQQNRILKQCKRVFRWLQGHQMMRIGKQCSFEMIFTILFKSNHDLKSLFIVRMKSLS